MSHEWWLRRRAEEREASRRLWEQLERARPPSDPEVIEEEAEVKPAKREAATIAAQH